MTEVGFYDVPLDHLLGQGEGAGPEPFLYQQDTLFEHKLTLPVVD